LAAGRGERRKRCPVLFDLAFWLNEGRKKRALLLFFTIFIDELREKEEEYFALHLHLFGSGSSS